MADPSTEKLWFRRFQQSPQAVSRLVCFPHAGGAAGYYRPLSAGLAGRTDVLAVQYPGRQDRYTEPCLTDVRELAGGVHRALGGLLDLPLTLFGHSMGASVAFEVARLLERDGHRPTRVFASGRRAPGRPHRGEFVHRRDDDGIVAELKELSGTDPAVFADPEVLKMVLPALRADYLAAETYLGEPGAVLESPITALTGEADSHTPIEDARAWQLHTSGDFRLAAFPGGHFFLTEQSTGVLAVLAEHLDSLGAPA